MHQFRTGHPSYGRTTQFGRRTGATASEGSLGNRLCSALARPLRRRAADPCRSVLDLRLARPVGRPPPHGGGGGLRQTHTGPGGGHPTRACRAATCSRRRRPAPARRPRSRCRSSTGCGRTGQHQLLARAPPGPRAHPRAHPRARGAGRRGHPHLRPHRAAALERGLWRRADRAADQDPAGRRRDPRRDPRTAARPRPAAHREPQPGLDPRAGRGRPHARHGLPPRHPQDHRAAPGPAPEPALLGHVRRRGPAPVGDDPARPGDGRGRAAEHRRGGRQASSSTRSTAIARRIC